MKKLILLIFLGFIAIGVNAQNNDFKSSKTQFMIRGYGHMGYESVKTNGETESTYNGGSFSPIFLFKHSDRLMFESELEFEINEGALELGFEYADIMYVLNDYMTIRGGKFLLPFGTFMERLHPSWVNRMPTKPLGFGHDGIAPGSGVGVELRGAFRMGTSTVNYSFYNTNGPAIKTPAGVEPVEAGMLAFNNLRDNNNSRAFGGRIGLLPFANNSTEVGFSFYSTDKVGATGSPYENLGANLYAIDFSYVKQLPSLGGIVDIKSQYNNSKVDNIIYSIEEEPGVFEDLDFDNQSHSFYAQLSYRPTMSGNNFFKNLEFVYRYSEVRTPEGSGFESNKQESAFGLNYWISWRSLIKLNYQSITGEGGHDVVGDFDQKGVFLHWAIGF
jgi:hypothetical protein